MSDDTLFTTTFGTDGTAYVRNNITGLTKIHPPHTQETTEHFVEELKALTNVFTLDTNYVNMVNRITKPKFDTIDLADPEFFQKVYARVKEMTATYEEEKAKQINFNSPYSGTFQDNPINY